MKQRDSFLIYFIILLVIFSFTLSTSYVFAHSSLESSPVVIPTKSEGRAEGSFSIDSGEKDSSTEPVLSAVEGLGMTGSAKLVSRSNESVNEKNMRFELKNEEFRAEIEDTEEEKDDIKKHLEKIKVQIEKIDSGTLLVRNGIGVLSPFPLSLDLNNNQFVIATLKGSKVLKVFPDQIVKDLLEDHVISVVRDVVKLDDINDSLVFEVNGVKIQKLLGFITVSNPIKVSVSVDSGKIISENKPLIAYLTELISF